MPYSDIDSNLKYIDRNISKIFNIVSVVFDLDIQIMYPVIKTLRSLKDELDLDLMGFESELIKEGEDYENAHSKALKEINSIFLKHMNEYKEEANG